MVSSGPTVGNRHHARQKPWRAQPRIAPTPQVIEHPEIVVRTRIMKRRLPILNVMQERGIRVRIER
jgi:hypothetical protein